MSDNRAVKKEETGFLVGGIILIGLGLLFMAIQMDWFYWLRWRTGWPLIIIVVGVALLINALVKNREKRKTPAE